MCIFDMALHFECRINEKRTLSDCFLVCGNVSLVNVWI